ncbi:MAG: Flp family type IVb pilin [Alphaproteobacteria bacterium]|nr:Flp family type IVb pilin [Alphaproteobacteria bacterium]
MRLLIKAAAFLANRRGATTIEYCLIAGLITLGLVGAITAWGQSANGMYMSLDTGVWG